MNRNVAYLANRYPAPSHTFIRREIEALWDAGVHVERFSIRKPSGRIFFEDLRERSLTTVLLDGVFFMLFTVILTPLKYPLGFLKALVMAFQQGHKSERGYLINLAYLAEACVLARHMDMRGVKHVHAHMGTNPTTVAMLCSALSGVTFSFTCHGPEEFDRASQWHLRDKIERASLVFAVSSFCRSQLYRHCPHTMWDKIHVVHCGVDASFLEPKPVAIPRSNNLVCVARLSEQKGHMVLLQALAGLERDGVDFQMHLVGDGELKEEIRNEIRNLGLTDNVTIHGWASEPLVRAFIRDARALILPSFAEGLPVVIMEALALGRPVVATMVGGIPELVDRYCGWPVPAGDAEALSGAIYEVLNTDEEKLFRMGKSGREMVKLLHDTKAIGELIAELMEPLI